MDPELVILCCHWNIEDVLGVAKQEGITLTEEQAADILQIMDDNHDAEQGVNWDIIQCNIESYLDDQY